MDVQELLAWLRERLSEFTGLVSAEVDADSRFRDLGLQSEEVLRLINELGKHVGQRFSTVLAWEHPTPRALATHVAQLLARTSAVADGGSVPKMARSLPRTAADAEEPIAIVGIACRFPGGVRDPDAFWQLLSEGRSGVREVPKERFDLEDYYDPDPSVPGKLSTRWAGLLDDIAGFDAEFFEISPREATRMDPQQRLVLEQAWRALEDAGVDPTSLRSSPTGVFVGAMWSDYARLLHADVSCIDVHTATGQDTSIISGRISYALGLAGPSLTVNSACSSSAVAVHLALQSLRAGEVSLALAAGVHVMASPESTVALTKFGAMNPAGKCRAFDADAAGYVRGEGVGVVVLKPLAKALADADDIYCVIRGSAVNNDGYSNGLTAPNPRAQEAVVQQALANAGVEASSIQYVETHGPGTVLGDPIEASSLGAVFAAGRTSTAPLRIGSVKTNIGHLEAGAGIAGLIKVALCLKHRGLVPNLHFERPNPHIPFEALRLQVQTEREPWPSSADTPPRAGLDSFGFGGTNCHIVCEAVSGNDSVIVPIAANTVPERRRRILAALGIVARATSGTELTSLCAAIAERCGTGQKRAVVVAHSVQDLSAKLTQLLSDTKDAARPPQPRPKLVFVCPGQGGHWSGMLRNLFGNEPAFRHAFGACDREVRARYGWSVVQELVQTGSRSRMHEPEVAQVVQLSVQIALGKLWMTWGVVPDAIIGHSLGEVAAACLAGILTLPDALHIAITRAQLMAASTLAQGGMLTVTLPQAEAFETARELAAPLELAAHNSPVALVFAGRSEDIEAAAVRLQAAGMSPRVVPNVSLAGHCSRMDEVALQLRAALGELRPHTAQIPVRSTVSRAWLKGPECSAEHWVANVRSTVRFREAVEAVSSDGDTLFLELGAHPVLLRAVQQTAASLKPTLIGVASCYRGEDERRRMHDAVATLFRHGFDPAWPEVTRTHAPESAELREELDVDFSPSPQRAAGPWLPVVLSARSPAGLQDQARSLRDALQSDPGLELLPVAQTSARRRASLRARAVAIAPDRATLVSVLTRMAAGDPSAAVSCDSLGAKVPLAFMFAGQGSQRARMGMQLLAELPLFREAYQGVLKQLELCELLAAPDGSETAALLDQTQYAQPALFALEVALYRTFEALGVVPDFVVGHSVGELSAAHVAGVLSLADASRLVVARGRLMQALPAGGAMLALAAREEELSSWLGRLSLAAVNAPEALVLSGDLELIQELQRELRGRSRETALLRVSHAFHSAHMDPMLEAYAELAATLEFSAPRIPFVSTVTGRLVAPDELTDPAYWVRQVRQTVRFGAAVEALFAAGVRHFVELGARSVLSPHVASTLPEVSIEPCLRASAPEGQTFLRALASVYVRGQQVAWPRLLEAHADAHARLPGYTFRHERFWISDARVAPAAPVASLSSMAELIARGDAEALADAAEATLPEQRALFHAVTPLLTRGLKRARQEEAVASALYRVTWVEQQLSAAARAATWWLLASPGDELARNLASALRAQGAGVWLGDLDSVTLTLPQAEAPTAILACVSDQAPAAEHSVPAGLLKLMAALRAWQAAGSPGPLWILTRGAARTHSRDAAPDPEQAMVAAMARVISLEHPTAWGGCLDLPSVGQVAPERVFAAISGAGNEEELALRDTKLFARRMERHAQKRSRRAPMSVRGTALVTGGAGVLGGRVARWLAHRGAEQIVLTSRSATTSAAALSLRQELAAMGTRVSLHDVDVSDGEALARLLEELRARGESPRTVVHAAGVSTWCKLESLSRSSLAETLRAKVLGAHHLDRLLRDPAPEHFVLFASGAGIWGGVAQGAYAAANGYLDALAQRRAAQGLAALSVAWGMWDGGGMGSESLELMRKRGVLALSPERALLALEQALTERVDAITVAELDWDQFGAVYAEDRPRQLFARLTQVAAAVPTSATEVFIGRLQATPEVNRERLLLATIAEALSSVLDVSAASMDSRRPFKELGMDSLMSLQLRRKLSELTGLQLKATVLYNYPTPRELALHLREQLLPKQAADLQLLAALDQLRLSAPERLSAELAAQVAGKLDGLMASWGLSSSALQRAARGDCEVDDLDDEQLMRLVDESIGQEGLGNGNG